VEKLSSSVYHPSFGNTTQPHTNQPADSKSMPTQNPQHFPTSSGRQPLSSSLAAIYYGTGSGPSRVNTRRVDVSVPTCLDKANTSIFSSTLQFFIPITPHSLHWTRSGRGPLLPSALSHTATVPAELPHPDPWLIAPGNSAPPSPVVSH